MSPAGAYLWEHLGEAPVLLVPCLHQRDLPALWPQGGATITTPSGFISTASAAPVLPRGAKHHFWPAAPLASAPSSTNHLRVEAEEFKAILGIPENVDTALMPIGVGRRVASGT